MSATPRSKIAFFTQRAGLFGSLHFIHPPINRTLYSGNKKLVDLAGGDAQNTLALAQYQNVLTRYDTIEDIKPLQDETADTWAARYKTHRTNTNTQMQSMGSVVSKIMVRYDNEAVDRSKEHSFSAEAQAVPALLALDICSSLTHQPSEYLLGGPENLDAPEKLKQFMQTVWKGVLNELNVLEPAAPVLSGNIATPLINGGSSSSVSAAELAMVVVCRLAPLVDEENRIEMQNWLATYLSTQYNPDALFNTLCQHVSVGASGMDAMVLLPVLKYVGAPIEQVLAVLHERYNEETSYKSGKDGLLDNHLGLVSQFAQWFLPDGKERTMSSRVQQWRSKTPDMPYPDHRPREKNLW